MELLVSFLTDFLPFSMRNMSRIHMWSSWFISLLISCIQTEYKQKSSVELLVYFLTKCVHFQRGIQKRLKTTKKQWFSIENTKHTKKHRFFYISAEIIEKPKVFLIFFVFSIENHCFFCFFY